MNSEVLWNKGFIAEDVDEREPVKGLAYRRGRNRWVGKPWSRRNSRWVGMEERASDRKKKK